MNDIKFRRFGVMLDCSRNAVMNVNTVKRYIDTIAPLGYNCLMLYTEETYEIEGEPYFGHNRGKYSKQELKEINAYAMDRGIELIPCIQTLAHLECIFKWPVYKKINDCNDILLADNEETYKLIDSMFETLEECFTSRIVNIGMDEAHMLGRGKYADINGHKERFEIILSHLNRVSEIADKHGFRIIMWGDMFLGGDLFVRLMQGREYTEEELYEAEKRKELIPENVEIIQWDYYSTDISTYNILTDVYSKLCDNVWFAGGLWTWTGFTPHNNFSMNVTELAFDNCFNHGLKDVFVTIWGDDGNECSMFSVLPSLYYASELAKGNKDEAKIKQGFKELYGIAFDDFMLIDLPGTADYNRNQIINTSKQYFYSDCFMGLTDNTVNENDGKSFGALISRLEKVSANEEWGYIFKTICELCKVLEIKTEIGLRTRKAYSEGDYKELERIIGDFDDLIKALDGFYKAFEEQWMIENKPHGFDVQDIRLGGLSCRTEHCKNRLKQYLCGKIPKIEELEEPMLDIYCRNENTPFSEPFWKNIVTANKI